MKVAVIGVGHLGRHHARIYSSMPSTELVGVVDTRKEHGENIAKEYNTKYFSDYKDLLGKVDAVSIATPTTTHFQIADDFMDAGAHILLEKPMTNEVKDAELLVEKAKSKNLKFQIGHIERFNPAVMAISKKELLPLYIEALRVSPFSFRSGDIGVVLDLMIHDIDIIQSFVKAPVKKVEAIGINLFGENEDIANARVVYETGCVVNITASRIARKSSRKIRIFAPDCYITLDYGERKGSIFDKPVGVDISSLNFQKSFPEKFEGKNFPEIFYENILKETKIEDICQKDVEPLYLQLEDFVDCIEKDREPLVAGADGLEAIKIADLIIKKSKEHFKCLKENMDKHKKKI